VPRLPALSHDPTAPTEILLADGIPAPLWPAQLENLELIGRVVWSQTVEGRNPTLPTGEVAAELVGNLDTAWLDLRNRLN